MDREQLPLKYRPHTFDDVVGQTHAVDVLRASLRNGRYHSSYIFNGAAGSGKTSAARIFAASLNCDSRREDQSPCLKCPSCTEALKDRNPDIEEIDGASHGQVEHVREIKERALFSPLHRKKVFIIDEVHALSASAFQALLKILEEPPSHVLFILATTNPERIPATIHSRSIKLDFRRHTEDDVVARLAHISDREGILVEPGAFTLVARYTDGGLRDSITVLDQLAVKADGKLITLNEVAHDLGIVSGSELHSIMDAVARHDANGLEEATATVLARTTEFATLTRAITDWYRDVLRTKAGVNANVIRRSESDRKLLDTFAAALSLEQINRAITACWELSDRVKFSSSNPKTFFLTGLYRLMLLADAVETKAEDLPDDTTLRQQAPTVETGVDFTTAGASLSDLEEQLRSLAG